MKQYVDLDETVTYIDCQDKEIIVRTRTIADILDEVCESYTPLEVWEIKEEEDD